MYPNNVQDSKRMPLEEIEMDDTTTRRGMQAYDKDDQSLIEPPSLAAKVLSDWGLSAKKQRSKMFDSQILDNSKQAIEELKKDSGWELLDVDDFEDDQEAIFIKKAKRMPLKSVRAEAIDLDKKKAALTSSISTGYVPRMRDRAIRRASRPDFPFNEAAREPLISEEDGEDDFELVDFPSPATHDSEWIPLDYVPPRKSSYRHTSQCAAGIDPCPVAISENETLEALTKGMPEIALTNTETQRMVEEHGGRPFREDELKTVHLQGETIKIWKHAPIECDETCPDLSWKEKAKHAVRKAAEAAVEAKEKFLAKLEHRGTIDWEKGEGGGEDTR